MLELLQEVRKMGNCIPDSMFWKESDVIGVEEEGWTKVSVMFSQSKKLIGVWVLPTDSMEEVDARVRTKYKINDMIWEGERWKPKLMMHRYGRSATVAWDVTVAEAKSLHFRYHFHTDIASEYISTGFHASPLTTVTRRLRNQFVFTKGWLTNAEAHHGDGMRDSTHIYTVG